MVVFSYWFNTFVLLIAVGACRKDWQELDPELVRSSMVYVESRESALEEAGDIVLAQVAARSYYRPAAHIMKYIYYC